MRSKLISWAKETVCSSTAEKRTVIRHLTIFGRFSGVTSMLRSFQLCMRSTKSAVVILCSTHVNTWGQVLETGDKSSVKRL